MSIKKYIRKNVYRWHRLSSLIVALPVLLWSVSGFLHPVMNSFKPNVRNQWLPASAIDTGKIRVPLQQALQQNKITALHNFRIVKLDTGYYFQVQQVNTDSLTYLNCNDGTLLENGDPVYASYLAQRYLSEPVTKEKHNASHVHGMSAGIALAPAFHSPQQYACAAVAGVKLITTFNSEYKRSNALLPVYRVSFQRSDGIRLYIETSTGRLAAAVDNKKAWFSRFFAITHSWSFLNGTGPAKSMVLGVCSLLCFITSVFGFYAYNILNKKKATNSSKSWHRVLGNVFVLTTALYGLSGAWHAFNKLPGKTDKKITADRNRYSPGEVAFSFAGLTGKLKEGETLNNISIVKVKGENYWQLHLSKGKVQQKKYIHTKTFEELPGGDMEYGRYLACLFSGKPAQTITHSKSLDRFTSRYSMMNKRLPVIEVAFKGTGNYYVETATGRLSAVAGAYDHAERFSFSNLHMHHYWEDWFGQEGRIIQKAVLVATTLGLLLLAITGCRAYWIKKHKSPGQAG